MMEDAYIGFNFSNTPDFVDFRVFKSIFNKNIIGIKYINKPVDGALGAESKISVTESAFTCKEYNSLVNFAFYNGLTTYNAYLANALDEAPLTKVGIQYHPKSLVGISVEGKRECLGCNTYSPLSTYISVTEGLVYDNLVQGIAVKGLNLSNFKSNKFIKITSPISGGNYSNLYGTIATGIYYNGKSSTSTTNSSLSYQTIKVGATNPSASQRNKFTNCYYGVYAKDEAIDVTYNDFTNCYNGIYLGNANVPSNYNTITNATIKNNQFLRLKYTGFTLDKNLSINVEIDGNNINNNSAPNFTSRAVDIIEVNAPVAAKYSVKNNNFGKVWCGTRASGANNPIFTNNYILLNTSTTFNGVTVGSALYNTGIQVVNCEKPQVNENEIFNGNNFNTWWEQGIVVNDCENGSYYCNDVNGTFSSITTGGVCPGTLIYKNDFHNAKFAHWLIYANVIGYQYNPTLSSTGNLYPNPPSFVQPADNRYYGISPLHSYTQNGTNGQLNARFYVRGNNAVSPYALLNNGNEFSSSSSPIFFPTINNAVFAYTPAGCNSNGGGVPNGRLMSLAKEIAIDNLYQPGDARNRFVSRKKLLSNIQKDGITNTGDTDIDNFTASISNEPVAKFFNVDMLAQQGVENADSNYFVQANTLNESVVPADSIEMIQQYVNKGYIIYLKSGGNLDADIIAVLQPIAALCPYRYGTSIWQARALLVGFDNTEYFNDCEFYSAPDDLLSTARMAQVIDDVRDEETTSKLAIFPNPNTGDFKVELPNVNAEVTIDIVNTVGAVVKQMSHKVTENNTMIEIQDLTQGLYFVIVKQNGVTIGTNRVVVTK